VDIFSESFKLQTRTILLAEDDQDDIFLFTESIKDFQIHFNLYVVQNGLDVLSYLDELKSDDLVFLDINMPGMNGFECLTEIRIKSKSVAVIMLSTADDADYIERARQLGATGYVIKPPSLELYGHAVKDILLTDWENYQLGFYTNAGQFPSR